MTDPVGSNPADSGRTRLWPAIVAVLALAGVVGVVGTLLISRIVDPPGPGPDVKALGPGDSTEVELLPVTYDSEAPFTEGVVTYNDDELAEYAEQAREAGASSGDTSRLYAANRRRPPCDLARLRSLLTEDPAVTLAWAEASGVEASAVGATVQAMTPVVLTRDTAVTNHNYGADGASPFQSVLEAGTPVLIDEGGAPRVQCSCGNPLRSPESDEDARTSNDPWTGYDPGRVDDGVPAAEPPVIIDLDDPVTTPTDPPEDQLELDGLLVSDENGAHVLDEETGDLTTVVDRQVDAIFDDGEGGLVYTLRRSDLGDAGLEDGPPDDLDEAQIWHLPAGTTEATPIVQALPGAWNRLLGVGSLGGRTFAIHAPLVADDTAQNTPTGPIVALDLDSGESTELLEQGFGWEVATHSISFGGDRLAMESGFAAPDWYFFGADLEPEPSPCSTALGGSDDPSEFIYDNCPGSGALNQDGNLEFYESGLSDRPSEETSEAIAVLDPSTGERVGTVPVDFGAFTMESSSSPVQARDGRVANRFQIEDQGPEAELLDAGTSELFDFSAAGFDRARSVWMLEAPLIRPVPEEPPTGDDTTGDDGTDLGAIDTLNMELPAGACHTDLDEPTPPMQLVDGEAEVGDPGAGYSYISHSADDVAVLDVDGDGTDELVVLLSCNWGGSGVSTNIVALREGPDGALDLVGEAFDEYRTLARTAGTIEAADDGELSVSGYESLDGDATCCPSGTFTARLAMEDGVWVEIDE